MLQLLCGAAYLGEIYQRRALRHILRLRARPYSPRCAIVEGAEELLLLLGCGDGRLGTKLVFCDGWWAGETRRTRGGWRRCHRCGAIEHELCDLYELVTVGYGGVNSLSVLLSWTLLAA